MSASLSTTRAESSDRGELQSLTSFSCVWNEPWRRVLEMYVLDRLRRVAAFDIGVRDGLRVLTRSA